MLTAQPRNRFVSIDVETANANMASICQIGGVVFEDGEEVASFCYLIDPQDDFDDVNVAIHGIGAADVVGCPVLNDVIDELWEWIKDEIVVSHTHFDRVSIKQACDKYELEPVSCTWLDSAKVARRTWTEVAYRGYGLKPVAQMLGIEFRHHDALEDARAAALIVCQAMQTTGLDLDGWLHRCTRPIGAGRPADLTILSAEAAGGPLAGESICFTGSLQIIRSEAALIANGFGAFVESGVTKKTTLLVVGDQDITRLNGAEKSGKHIKAETMIAKGHSIRIVRETDFAQLCDLQYL